MILDPPIEMVHPEALRAQIEIARGLDGLEHLFGDATEYRALLARSEVFLAAVERLLSADPTPDALRAATALVNEASKKMHAALPAYWELVWRRAIEASLADPTGFTARAVLDSS
jgi:hypothetical protein